MNLDQVVKRIPYWYASRKCIYLTSPPGRGKTETLSAAPTMLSKMLVRNLGLVVLNGPLLTPADSIGYLVPKHSEHYTESIYTDPFWWRTREGKRLGEYDGGIILVDEADKMDTDVKKVIGEAALSGRLGPHSLPPGWVIWMAGNRAEDRSGSTKELDHLINRRLEIAITDDVQSWTNWAMAHLVQPMTVAFANQNTQIVFDPKRPEKQGPWCTPRSLVGADDYLKVLGENLGDIPDDPSTIEEISGMIGMGAATQLFAFVRLEREMPKYETIKANPMGAKLPAKPDAQMLVCFNLAHRVTQEDAAPIITYIERMPKEFAVTFLVAAVKRIHSLVNTPAVAKWTSENASLMAAINK